MRRWRRAVVAWTGCAIGDSVAAMTTGLTAEQVGAYREDGYLALADFLDGAELELWRAAVDDGVARQLGNPRPESSVFDNQGRDDAYARVFVQCVNMWKVSGAMRELVLDERLGKLASDLAGMDAVRLYHDHALIKKPWANPTTWHTDNPVDPFFSQRSIMLWIALDDATLQNGCLYVLPGSHRSSRFDTGGDTSSARIDALFDAYPEWRKIDPVPVEVSAGGAVFLSGLVAHAAGPNMTRGRRRAFSILFMPDDAVFNGHKSALPEAVAARLQAGDPIADDEHLPHLYSRRLQRDMNT